jgi:CubicO group peptidase (beta-lactamase class C family)
MYRTLGGVLGALALLTPASAAASGCGFPRMAWTQVAPATQRMDAARLAATMNWATEHDSASVAVYRHGCLVAASAIDGVTGDQPIDGWSMTKSVSSLLIGRAVTLGALKVDERIGRFYPQADAAHRRLTVRNLLEMSAGLHRNWVRDLSPQPDRVRDALALKFDHRPGTHWEYQQSTVTLLLDVLQHAVGRDVQAWAQDELFGPVGIRPGGWSWERDRAGHTEGWAHLHMSNRDFARLGQLVLRDGSWRGRRLIARSYLRRALHPNATNGAYGFLWWLNGGRSWIMPSVYGPDTGKGWVMPYAPPDMVLMAGMQEQRTYVIPSRDLVVVRMGFPGSKELDTRVTIFAGRAGELDHEILRGVLSSVLDVPYEDPGPYPGSSLVLPPVDDGLPGDAADLPEVAAGTFGP